MIARSIDSMAADRPSARQAPTYPAHERRGSVRVDLPFPALVRGVDARGERFEVETVLDNLSTSGLYLRLPRPIDQGAKLFICVQLTLTAERDVPSPRVALHGVVLWTEPQADGRCGVAVAFERHRFLYTYRSNVS